nr:hypothetical protein [Clostridia bacterium]
MEVNTFSKSKLIAALLIFVLVFTMIPADLVQSSYAGESEVLSQDSYYHLDLGVQCCYTNPKDSDLPYDASTHNFSALLTMGRHVKVVGAYTMDKIDF